MGGESSSENKIEKFEFTFTNHPYKAFDLDRRKLITKKGSIQEITTYRNDVICEHILQVIEDDRIWKWKHRIYQNGKLKECKFFYENGLILRHYIYHSPSCVECVLWYPFEGKILGRRFWSEEEPKPGIKIRRLNGPTKGWHKNGQLALEETYKDGKLYGERTRYSSNGDIL
jgi:antitoxin component YwqK of YwqJK toxin-antitoxin module